MRRGRSTNCAVLFWVMLLVASTIRPAHADMFTYRDAKGETIEVEARLVANEKGAFVLELDDGEYRIIAEQSVMNRVPKEGPAPASAAVLLERLQKKFGAQVFRGHKQDGYVLGLVLSDPLPKNAETRATNALKQAGTYLRGVNGAFGAFAKDLQIPVKPPTHQLIVLIFETDEVFEKYTNEILQGQGMAPRGISGFYSGITNVLAIRMSECFTFEVPLHEAIHQQVYNRHMFQRLAPIPHWFDEGIATGFEGNRVRISSGPTKVTPRYAQQALAARSLNWDRVLTDDRIFMGDVLVGEAYGYAWALHWLLITKYRPQYAKYVRMLAEKTPLGADSPELRRKEFKDTIGIELETLREEFRGVLETAISRQKISLSTQPTPGQVQTQQSLASVELRAIRRVNPAGIAGGLEVQGKLQNISPLRPMAFLVSVETDGGLYNQWLLPEVAPQQTVAIGPKMVERPTPGGPGRASNSFFVKVRSVPAGSSTADQWHSGNLPVPVFQPQ